MHIIVSKRTLLKLIGIAKVAGVDVLAAVRVRSAPACLAPRRVVTCRAPPCMSILTSSEHVSQQFGYFIDEN